MLPFRRNLLVAVAALATFSAGIGLAVWFTICTRDSCPSVESLGSYDPDQAAKVYAADGRLITDLGL